METPALPEANGVSSETFSKLYQRHWPKVFKMIFGKVSNSAQAEDLSQEVFLKAFRARELYRSEFAFTTWLWGIARNTLTDWFRSNGRLGLSVSEIGPFENPVDQLRCNGPSPEDVMETKAKHHLVQKIQRELSVVQHQVLVLRIVEQMSYRDISATLGISMAAVKSLIFRAKQVLAQAGVAAGYASDFLTAVP